METTFDSTGLLPYQVEASQSVAESLLTNSLSVDFSDLGIGKTFTAGAAIRHVTARLQSRFFIVCPRTVKKNWLECCEHFGIKPFGVVNYEKIVRGSTPFVKYKRVRDSFGKLTKEYDYVWKLPKDMVLCFDEIHKAKGHETLTGKLFRAAKKQNYRIHCLSATAAVNPLEMFSLGYVLGLHDGNYKNFKQWCKNYGCEPTGHFGAMTFDHKSDLGQTAMRSIHREIFHDKKLGVRIKREDLGDKFPESLITADAVDCGDQTTKINRAYEQMAQELAKLEAKASGYKNHIFAIIMEARRRVELLKIPTILDMVTDALENGKSVVVFLNFTDSIDALASRLKKYEISKVIGGQTDVQRQLDIDKFQSGITRICLANEAAGGVGISLHDLTGNNERYSIVSPSYSAIQMVQCFGRVWRQGGGWSRQTVVFAAGTIEDRICYKVRGKLKNINLLNDGDLTPSSLKF